jgi:hypothetical protein
MHNKYDLANHFKVSRGIPIPGDPTSVCEGSESVQWSATPYLWASDTTVDLSFRNDPVGGDQLSFNDLLDVLDSAFMINVEAGRGNWSLFGYQYKQAEFEDDDLTLDFSYRGPMAGFNFLW